MHTYKNDTHVYYSHTQTNTCKSGLRNNLKVKIGTHRGSPSAFVLKMKEFFAISKKVNLSFVHFVDISYKEFRFVIV